MNENEEGYFEYLEEEADKLLEHQDGDELELGNVAKDVEDALVPDIVYEYEREAPSFNAAGLTCEICGKQILDRPTFRESKKCLACMMR